MLLRLERVNCKVGYPMDRTNPRSPWGEHCKKTVSTRRFGQAGRCRHKSSTALRKINFPLEIFEASATVRSTRLQDQQFTGDRT